VGLIFVIATVKMYEMWGKQMHETELDKEFWRAVPITFATKTSWFLRRPLQRRAEIPVLGIFLVRNSAASLRADPLVHSTGSMESSLPALFRGDRASAAALLSIGLFIIHVYMGTAMERALSAR